MVQFQNNTSKVYKTIRINMEYMLTNCKIEKKNPCPRVVFSEYAYPAMFITDKLLSSYFNTVLGKTMFCIQSCIISYCFDYSFLLPLHSD